METKVKLADVMQLWLDQWFEIERDQKGTIEFNDVNYSVSVKFDNYVVDIDSNNLYITSYYDEAKISNQDLRYYLKIQEILKTFEDLEGDKDEL